MKLLPYKYLFILAVVIVGGGGALAAWAGQPDSDSPTALIQNSGSPVPRVSPTPATGSGSAQSKPASASEALGTIKGASGFPAGGAPSDLKVCAVNLATQQPTCSTSIVRSEAYKNGLGYTLSVPAGTYQVYSVADTFRPNFRGYYTALTRCYATASDAAQCTDNTILSVTVSPGATMEAIDAYDYYGPHNK